MVTRRTYAALDVGNSKVACLIGTVRGSGDIEFAGLGVGPSAGIEKGIVTDASALARSIHTAVQEAEPGSGEHVSKVYISMSGAFVSSRNSRGQVSLPQESPRVTPHHVSSALQKAAEAAPAVAEILHVIPRSYAVDNKNDLKNPVGLSGSTLSVEAHLVYGERVHIRSVVKAVEASGYRVHGVVFSPIASGMAVITRRELDRGVIVVDLGHSTTNVAIFHQGSVCGSFVIPAGGYHVSADIAAALGTTYAVGDEMKRKYGHADPEAVPEEECLQAPSYIAGQTKEVTHRWLSQIIKARLEEILAIGVAKAAEVGYSLRQLGTLVLTGGTANMPGLEALARTLSSGLTVRVGTPTLFKFASPELRDPAMASCSGVLLWTAYNTEGGKAPVKEEVPGRPKDLAVAVREWIRDILPV